MKFSNLRIGARLSLSFAAILLLLLIEAGVGWSALSGSNARTEVITLENNVKTASANAIGNQLDIIARVTREVILYGTPEQRAKQQQRVGDARAVYAAEVKKLGSMIRTDAGKKALADMQAAIAVARPEVSKVIELAEAGKSTEAAEHLRDTAQPLQDKIFVSVNDLIALLEKQNAESISQMRVAYEQAIGLLAGVTILAVLLSMLFAWFVTRSIVRPISHAVALAQLVAANDLLIFP